MKNILFVSFLIVIDLCATVPLKVPNYDPFRQTEKILKKHVSLTKSIKTRSTYVLYAIYDDKVNINGRFYTLGDRIGSCHLWRIMKERVILRCHRSIKTLKFTRKKTYKREELVQ